ncbi:MAG: hypothetical protein HZA03_00830 [Nitrospinae bacterium]|nr:hypothetical protein [Nitrospinota bacterium]
MNPLRRVFAFAALLAFWAVPVFAAEHCGHAKAAADAHAAHVAQSDGGGLQQHRRVMNAAAEEIPAGGEGGEAACEHHLGEACKCKAQTALSCGMEGCCIKADGPLSAGLNDRLPTNDDHALSIQTVPSGINGQMVIAAHRRMIIPRDLTGPDPRPPSA